MIKRIGATRDMTEGSIAKQLLLFALPLMAGNIFQMLYNTVDVIVVGNYVGKEALAAVVMVTIHEGRNRQVRRMFEVLGYKVLMLRRVRFVALERGELKRGQWRYLDQREIGMLKRSVQ